MNNRVKTTHPLIDRMRHVLQLRSLILRKITVPHLGLNCLLVGLSFFPVLSHSETTSAPVFRFHIPTEPSGLDPARLTSTDASYFFNNLMRGLYSYSNQRGLINEGAESCQFETILKLRCRLSKESKWSDGSSVVAADYLRAFRRLVAPQAKNPSVELLRKLKNTVAIHSGQLPVEKLGVQADGDLGLIFEFAESDPDFLYKLTSSILVPIKSENFPNKREESKQVVVNGPYRVSSWTSGRRVRLELNPYYKLGNPHRPPVEVLFIDDDQTAFLLYAQGELTFLRRLPVHDIPQFRGKAEFHEVPVARFDYVGFGGELKDQAEMRSALSHSADFRELQKLYDSLGLPGCPSLPEELIDQARCVKFDLKLAREALAKVPPAIKSKRLKFYFSKLGGDDVKRGAEWFQAQWKKNLGLTVDLAQTEQGVLLNALRTSPPEIFRKGVGLERPTCLAALETFAAGGSENFLALNDRKYQEIIDRLSHALEKTDAVKMRNPDLPARKLCGEGIQYLLDQTLLIPLGRFQFAHLAKSQFTGWTLNEMNQLDLSQLSRNETQAQ